VRIGFVGLGNMGRPMVENLLRAGLALKVYNRTREKAEGLEGDLEIVASPADAADEVDVLVTMLAEDRVVEGVVFGGDSEPGVLSALAKGTIHVSSSTISVALSRRLQAAHAAAGQGCVAAPVFGRPEAARARKLWVAAAGAPHLLDRCTPLVLEAAESVEAPMPLASLLRDHLLAQVARGRGGADWSSIAEVSARNAGLGDRRGEAASGRSPATGSSLQSPAVDEREREPTPRG
jgi:3-hydroxyisobutyrate dehydrogenase-like beta-hydroxyacid dehydrogenase